MGLHKVLRARQIPFPPILGYVKATIHPWTCCSAGEPPKSSAQTLGNKGHLHNNWIVARFAAQVWIVGYVCYSCFFVLLAVLVARPVCEAGRFAGGMCANEVRARAHVNTTGGS